MQALEARAVARRAVQRLHRALDGARDRRMLAASRASCALVHVLVALALELALGERLIARRQMAERGGKRRQLVRCVLRQLAFAKRAR